MKTFLLSILIFSFASIAQTFNNTELNSSDSALVAFYPFNGNANDESGNNHDGSVSGATIATDRFNKSGRAYNFVYNGFSSDRIEVSGTSDFNFSSGGFSISAWVEFSGPAASGNNYPIFSKHICGEQSGYILMLYNGKLTFWLAGSGGYNILSTPDDYTDNSWHQVVAVYDGVTQAVYVDGLLKNSISFNYNTFNSANWALGGYNGCNGGFNGKVDEIKVLNRALSGSEVQDMYNQSANHLVAFYPFNGNANDESGNANNPTYIGSGVTLTTDRLGNADKAYYFDGNIDSYIRIPADNFPTTDRTISFWFYAEQLDNHPTPLSYGGDVCNNSVLMIINKGDYPNAYTVLSHCASNFISAPYSSPPINNWYYLTMTISGVTQKIFINGELQQTANTFNTPTFVTGKSVIFGAILYTDGSTVYDEPTAGEFQGKLDDFRFYNSAMTDLEVQNLYNSEANGLVASYPFKGNANDESGSGNNGINHNGIFSKDRFGNDNSSMLFSGNDSYVEGINPGNNLPAGNSPRTITAWIKENSFHPWGNNIFHYGLDQAAPTNFHLYTTDVIRIGNGYDFGVVFGTTPIVDSTWHFVAGVYEGGTEHIAKVYVDGKLDGAGVISTEPNTILSSNWKIGRFMTGSNNFDGDIDELKVYNFALTYQKIFDLYKATTTAPKLLSPGNDSTLINPYLTIILDWDSTVTANQYRLLIASDSLFNTIVKDTITNISSFDFYYEFFIYFDNLYWKVRTLNDGGIGPWSEVNHFNFIYTDVKSEDQLPTEFALVQNYPNPFNPSTKIIYQLPVSSNVTLKVFDVLGNEVVTLVDEYKPAGNYEIEFSATGGSSSGRNVAHESLRASGVYFYQLKAGSYIQTKKMILLR